VDEASALTAAETRRRNRSRRPVEAAVEPEVQAVDGEMGSVVVLGVTEYQSI
jgi:hypothetical protein